MSFFPQKGLHAYSMDNYCPQTHVNKRQTNKLLLHHSMLKYTNFRNSPKSISWNSKVYYANCVSGCCTWNMETLVFDAEGVSSLHLWGEHHSVVEVLLVHDLTQLCGAVGVCYRGLHIKWISSWKKSSEMSPFILYFYY